MAEVECVVDEPPETRTFYHPGCSFNQTDGYVGNLTMEQSIALKLLKKSIRAAGIDLHKGLCKHPDENRDAFLLRFLRARNFHVEESKKMLYNDVEWRIQFGVEPLMNQTAREILGCDPVDVNELYPHWTHKVDKFGRPVMWEKTGGTYIDEVLKLTTHDKVVNYHVWRAEQNTRMLHWQTKLTGYQVDTFTSVIDVSGMGLTQITRKFLALVKEIAQIDQDHYPERMGQLFICNIPGVFAFVWAGIKPWLPQRTLDKIKILSCSQTADELKLHIDECNIPEEFGGTCRCKGGCLPMKHDPDAAVAATPFETPGRMNKLWHRRTNSMDSQATGSFHSVGSGGSKGPRTEDTHSEMTHLAHYDEESDDEALTPEEAIMLEETRTSLVRTRTQFMFLNMLTYMLGMMLIGLAAYARSMLWFDNADEVKWTAWLVSLSLLLGSMLLLTGFLGHYGLNVSSPRVLHIYGLLLLFFAVQISIAGIALVAVYDQISDWFPVNKEDAEDVKDMAIIFGCCATVAGLLLLIPGIISFGLKKKIETQPDPIDDNLELRVLLRIISVAILLLSLVNTGLGYALALLASYTNNYVFGMFVFTVGSVLTAFSAGFIIMIASTSKTEASVFKLQMCRWAILALVLGLISFVITTGFSIDRISNTITRNWDEIQNTLPNEWNQKSMDSVISHLLWNRIFVVASSMMLTSLLVFVLVILDKFKEYIENNMHDDAEPTKSWASLPTAIKLIVLWGCVSACFELFWEGQYLMFAHWISTEGTADTDYDQSWFVASWFLIRDADSRYKTDNTVVFTLTLLAATFGTTLCIMLSWCSYEQRASRHGLGLLASSLQIYYSYVYFTSEAYDSFKDTPGSSSPKFWLIFLLIPFLRCLIAVPVFVYSWTQLHRAVKVSDAQVVKAAAAALKQHEQEKAARAEMDSAKSNITVDWTTTSTSSSLGDQGVGIQIQMQEKSRMAGGAGKPPPTPNETPINPENNWVDSQAIPDMDVGHPELMLTPNEALSARRRHRRAGPGT